MKRYVLSCTATILICFPLVAYAEQIALLVSDSDTSVASKALETLDLPHGLAAAVYSSHQLGISEAARAQAAAADVIVIDVMIDELTDFLVHNVDTETNAW